MNAQLTKLSNFFINYANYIANCLSAISAGLGVLSIGLAMQGDFSVAVICVTMASILDFCDGAVARLNNKNNIFGVQLDSLVDLISFGLAPAIILYIWCFQGIFSYHWLAVIFYNLCAIFRLALFNTKLAEADYKESNKYFIGAPSPFIALFLLLPIVTEEYLGTYLFPDEVLVIIFIFSSGLLMVSQIPFINLKYINIPISAKIVFLVILAFICLLNFWLAYIICCAIYLLTLPVSIYSFIKDKS